MNCILRARLKQISNYIKSIYRQGKSGYSCICDEKCLEKGLVLCRLDKSTRCKCKHCRYRQCMDVAGMCPRWVVQQYIPKVENEQKRGVLSSVETTDSNKDVCKYCIDYFGSMFLFL